MIDRFVSISTLPPLAMALHFIYFCFNIVCPLLLLSLLLFHSLQVFFIPVTLVFFQWSLIDSKSRQVSRTHLSIPFDLSNALVWEFRVSILSLISRFSCLFNWFLGIVPNIPTTVWITFTFIFHRFLNPRARAVY